jgi:hypothetical protein
MKEECGSLAEKEEITETNYTNTSNASIMEGEMLS